MQITIRMEGGWPIKSLTHEDDTIVDGVSKTGQQQQLPQQVRLTYDTLDIFATTTDNENYYYVK
jgi:hypothetical protein